MLDALQKQLDDSPPEEPAVPSPTSVKVPDGWKVTRSKGSAFCSQDMSTDSASDKHSYENMVSSKFGIPKTGMAYKGTGFSFGLSAETKDFVKQNGQEKQKMVSSSAECSEYYAELDMEDPPETEPSFKFLVDTLKEEKDYYGLFDMYGLHFANELVFGARAGKTTYIKESSFSSFQKTDSKMNIEFGISVAVGVGAGVKAKASKNVKLGFSSSDQQAKDMSKYMSETKEFSVGRRMAPKGFEEWTKDANGEPMPIRFSFVSLCDHPGFSSKKAECHKHAASYCPNHLQRMHPDLSCDAAKPSDCTWDIDCDEPHSICRQGYCLPKPNCNVTIGKGCKEETGKCAEEQSIGPFYYSDSQPQQIITVPETFIGFTSLAMSAGCGKVVLMERNQLDNEDNGVYTNWDSNARQVHKDAGDVDSKWLGIFPKKEWVDLESNFS